MKKKKKKKEDQHYHAFLSKKCEIKKKDFFLSKVQIKFFLLLVCDTQWYAMIHSLAHYVTFNIYRRDGTLTRGEKTWTAVAREGAVPLPRFTRRSLIAFIDDQSEAARGKRTALFFERCDKLHPRVLLLLLPILGRASFSPQIRVISECQSCFEPSKSTRERESELSKVFRRGFPRALVRSFSVFLWIRLARVETSVWVYAVQWRAVNRGKVEGSAVDTGIRRDSAQDTSCCSLVVHEPPQSFRDSLLVTVH